jgi:uncharacterized protein (TIGR03067 family)
MKSCKTQKLSFQQLLLIGFSYTFVATSVGVVLAQFSLPTSVSIAKDAPKPNNPIATQLLGHWTGKVGELIFTPEGKLFQIPPSSSGDRFASQGKYQINANSQPKHLDLEFVDSEGQKIRITAIFEFASNNKLRLQLPSGSQRPTKFTSRA